MMGAKKTILLSLVAVTLALLAGSLWALRGDETRGADESASEQQQRGAPSEALPASRRTRSASVDRADVGPNVDASRKQLASVVAASIEASRVASWNAQHIERALHAVVPDLPASAIVTAECYGAGACDLQVLGPPLSGSQLNELITKVGEEVDAKVDFAATRYFTVLGQETVHVTVASFFGSTDDESANAEAKRVAKSRVAEKIDQVEADFQHEG